AFHRRAGPYRHDLRLLLVTLEAKRAEALAVGVVDDEQARLVGLEVVGGGGVAGDTDGAVALLGADPGGPAARDGTPARVLNPHRKGAGRLEDDVLLYDCGLLRVENEHLAEAPLERGDTAPHGEEGVHEPFRLGEVLRIVRVRDRGFIPVPR